MKTVMSGMFEVCNGVICSCDVIVITCNALLNGHNNWQPTGHSITSE